MRFTASLRTSLGKTGMFVFTVSVWWSGIQGLLGPPGPTALVPSVMPAVSTSATLSIGENVSTTKMANDALVLLGK